MSVRTAHTDSAAAPVTRGSTRSVLWVLLVVSATCNVVTSASHMLVVSIVFGLLTLSFGTALVRQHYRGRRG